MSKQPDPYRSLREELSRIKETLRRMASASPFFGTGMHPNGNQGLDSDNYVPATSGFSLNGGTGIAEFRDIVLYDLPNSMLASPVKPQTVWQRASGFSVGPAWADLITVNVTVPDGYTTADIDARARVTAFYNNAGTGSGVDYLYAILYVGTADSEFYPLAVTDNGGSGTNHVFRNKVLTGLSGGDTVTLNLQGSTSYNTWAAPYSNNVAQLGASIRWTR